MNYDETLRLARQMMGVGVRLEDVASNPVIPPEFRDAIHTQLQAEQNVILTRVGAITNRDANWLHGVDRSKWYYWLALRDHLISHKGWPTSAVRSLDNVTDQILGYLEPPSLLRFDIRGLVIGYVQSGKTSNFTALIAKASDIGYRLIIVLTGRDNLLRRQTQIRLKRELVGYPDNRPEAVTLPPPGLRWHEFTTEDIQGDFRPGYANHAALQTGQPPVLLVIKKNGAVLRRLQAWLDAVPTDAKNSIPLLLIDDEADDASPDTKGSRQTEEDPDLSEYESPSRINERIRYLLSTFQKKAYVAYTATPFANMLIPHDNYDPNVERDLYPKDFIVTLPKPSGYFGAEELFGRFDPETDEYISGIDVVMTVPDEDLHQLNGDGIPPSLENALLDFVIAGAAKAQRGLGSAPATMLIHVSRLIDEQTPLARAVRQRFEEVRDEWRYQRDQGIRDRIAGRWNERFRPLIRFRDIEQDVPFSDIERHITSFFDAVQMIVINSRTGQMLDYEREPNLKAIVIGGDRLSRGLTLEGLLTSYFVRRSKNYDTLMQMGRWFGFRAGYEDLTRIYTTRELGEWFADLAFMEQRLREDIQIYEDRGITPIDAGTRIWQHPVMRVTSALKMRYAKRIDLQQSFAGTIEQTFKFPLNKPDDLAVQAEANRLAVRIFLPSLGTPEWHPSGPRWHSVPVDRVMEFLRHYRVDSNVPPIQLDLILEYIERMAQQNELIHWTVAVRGREEVDLKLGDADWNVAGGHIHQISRSRLKRDTQSLGVVTNPGDEAIGLDDDQKRRAEEIKRNSGARARALNWAARQTRSKEEGLLLLYPISRHSGHERVLNDGRQPLYADPDDPLARDLLGLAISFPQSDQPQPVESYVIGTAPQDDEE